MKKIVSIILSLVFVLTMATAGFAARVPADMIDWQDDLGGGAIGWDHVDWPKLNCTVRKAGHIEALMVFNQKAKDGSVSVNMGDKATNYVYDGLYGNTSTETGFYFMANITPTDVASGIVTSQVSDGYVVVLENVDLYVALYKVNGSNLERTELAKIDLDDDGFMDLGENGSRPCVTLKANYTADGAVEIFVAADGEDEVRVINYTPAEDAVIPTGNRVALTSRMPNPNFIGGTAEAVVIEWVTVECTNHVLVQKEARTEADCLMGTCDAYWTCESCGENYSDAAGTQALVTEPNAENHVGAIAGTAIRSDEEGHWTVCACGENIEVEAHASEEFEFDDVEHWAVCDECGAEIRGDHVDEDDDNLCDDCGYVMEEEPPVVNPPVVDPPVDPDPVTPGDDKTDDKKDDNNLVLPIVIAVVAVLAVAAVVVVVVIKKKKN